MKSNALLGKAQMRHNDFIFTKGEKSKGKKEQNLLFNNIFFCESANMTEVWKCAWIVMITGEGEWFFPKNKPEKKICVFVKLRYFFLLFLSTF